MNSDDLEYRFTGVISFTVDFLTLAIHLFSCSNFLTCEKRAEVGLRCRRLLFANLLPLFVSCLSLFFVLFELLCFFLVGFSFVYSSISPLLALFSLSFTWCVRVFVVNFPFVPIV